MTLERHKKILVEQPIKQKETGNFTPKVVLITGAGSGIGLATARILARVGHIIYATGKEDKTELDAVFSHKIDNLPQNIITGHLNVRNGEEIQETVGKIIEEQGKIDVLINNAGQMYSGSFEHTWKSEKAREMARDMFETNTIGPVHLMSAVIPYMKKNQEGIIINVTSSQPFQPHWPGLPYALSKLLLMRATRSAREQYKENGIKFFEVQPGRINYTNIDSAFFPDTPEADRKAALRLLDSFRKKMGGNPQQVADVMAQIVGGEIDKDVVTVGKDAAFAKKVIARYPLLAVMFGFAFNTATYALKKSVYRKEIVPNSSENPLERFINFLFMYRLFSSALNDGKELTDNFDKTVQRMAGVMGVLNEQSNEFASALAALKNLPKDNSLDSRGGGT